MSSELQPGENGTTPRLTIGIPTYNRADMLRGAIESALSQSLAGLDIIISDNASTDHTPEIISSFGRRIRYHRNESNLGPVRNFYNLVRMAGAEYFVWLQDDDLLHHQFAERAFKALEANPSAAAYAAYALVSPSATCQHFPTLYGPPFPLDWMNLGKPARISGRLIAPLSLLISVAIMPVIAFRKDALLAHIDSSPQPTELFGERTLLSAVTAESSLIVEPYVGGFFRIHRDQHHQRLQRVDGEQSRQWNIMAKDLDRMTASWPQDWIPALTETLSGMPLERRCSWARESLRWPDHLALCQIVSACLMNGLPWEQRNEVSLLLNKPCVKARIKKGMKAVVPPVVWNGVRALSRFVRRSQ